MTVLFLIQIQILADFTNGQIVYRINRATPVINLLFSIKRILIDKVGDRIDVIDASNIQWHVHRHHHKNGNQNVRWHSDRPVLVRQIIPAELVQERTRKYWDHYVYDVWDEWEAKHDKAIDSSLRLGRWCCFSVLLIWCHSHRSRPVYNFPCKLYVCLNKSVYAYYHTLGYIYHYNILNYLYNLLIEFRIYNRLFQIILLMIYKNCTIYS